MFKTKQQWRAFYRRNLHEYVRTNVSKTVEKTNRLKEVYFIVCFTEQLIQRRIVYPPLFKNSYIFSFFPVNRQHRFLHQGQFTVLAVLQYRSSCKIGKVSLNKSRSLKFISRSMRSIKDPTANATRRAKQFQLQHFHYNFNSIFRFVTVV